MCKLQTELKVGFIPFISVFKRWIIMVKKPSLSSIPKPGKIFDSPLEIPKQDNPSAATGFAETGVWVSLRSITLQENRS